MTKTYKKVNYFIKKSDRKGRIEIINILEEYVIGDRWECCGIIVYSEIVPQDTGIKWNNTKNNLKKGYFDRQYQFSKKGFSIPKTKDLRFGQIYQPMFKIPPIKP